MYMNVILNDAEYISIGVVNIFLYLHTYILKLILTTVNNGKSNAYKINPFVEKVQ